MSHFLDTCIIIGYANMSSEINLDKNSKKCIDFVDKKQGKFIVCYFSIDKDIASLIKRTRIIIREIKRKLNNLSYEIGDSKEGKELYKQDIIRANKYYALKDILLRKEVSPINFFEQFQEIFEFRIDFFLKNFVDELVIPIEEINKELVSILREFIDDYSDCNVFASVLQYTTESKSILETRKIIFTTLDKEHFNENNIAFIKEDPKLKNYEFPEVKILI